MDLSRGHALIHSDESKTKRAIPVPLNKKEISTINAQIGKNAVYVFTYHGNPVTRCNNHAWQKALERAGIEDFRWHDLRTYLGKLACAKWNAFARVTTAGWLVEL